MAMFNKLSTDGLEESQDTLGGGSFIVPSGVYAAKIKVAYAAPATSGAMGIVINAVLEGGKEFRETVYITNKKGENFFLNKQDPSKKVPLPGFTTVDDLCLICTGAPLSEAETEEKIVNVWDPEERKELPKAVQVLTGLVGADVLLGIIHKVENKSTKQGNEYVPINEKREFNTIDKVFHPEHEITVAEARSGVDKPTFINAWKERNEGKTQDKFKEVTDTGRASAPRGAAPQAGSAPAPRTSLFAKK